MTKLWFSAACLAPLVAFAAPASAEARDYVIRWFATATYNSNCLEACPETRNGGPATLICDRSMRHPEPYAGGVGASQT